MERGQGVFDGFIELFGRGAGADALKGWGVAGEDERGDGEALALQRAGFEVLGVGAGLGFGCGAECDGVEGVFTGHNGERKSGVGNVAGDGTGVVELPVERSDARERNQPASRKDAHERAGRDRHADGVAGVCPVAEHGEVRGD